MKTKDACSARDALVVRLVDLETGAVEWRGLLAELLEQNKGDEEVAAGAAQLADPGDSFQIGGGASPAFRVEVERLQSPRLY